ncbi:MAG: T9SS type A sorting domain-containing protein [Candidatus Eisenbacteria bacterium]|uniref:T9SS type A sorting domain-containing protein n=1 Tax=Eiseniibacteriota bacterium TaxID=2212470 RepID=A0A948WE12_UNCEI|nr:T9SS type A sorting domain-containing protein [Candidatus Eisenbacteria bacterium]
MKSCATFWGGSASCGQKWLTGILTLTGLFLALFAIQGFAEEIPTSELGRTPEIQILHSDDAGVSLRFELIDLVTETATIDGTEWKMLAIPGGDLAGEIGRPALPTFSRLVSIPNQSGVDISVTIEEEETRTGYRVMPMQGNDGDSFAYDAAAYDLDDFGSTAAAMTGDPAILRDQRVVTLTFQPVQYNPAQGIIKVARRIRVDVQFAGVDLRNSLDNTNRRITPSFNKLYRSTILNYVEPDRADIVPGSYLLICPNDAAVINLLQPLIEWRERKGAPVILATTAETGASAANILSYIQTVYASSDPPLEFVCLVGDANGTYAIPTWFESYSGYNGEGDNPYTLLAGGDVLSDIHIGRISIASLSELELIVAKTVGYESEPYMEETDWYKRACLVADTSPSGWSCVTVQQWIKTRLIEMGYTDIDTLWPEPVPPDMITELNKGDTFFSYRGYLGMSSWSSSNAYSLTNGWKMPFCVNITCDTGSFASGTARSEGFLRAGSVNPITPKGGVGSIGTATTGTHTRYNNCMHYGIHHGMLYDELYEMGAALTRGKVEMYINYQLREPTKVQIWSHWNNLMGDPAGEIFTDIPVELSVNHPASLYRGANSLAVSVTAGPLPVADAQVCLLKDGETYIVGYTDGNGEVELPIVTDAAGDLLVTVTKHNCLPYLATVPVTNPTLFVGFESFTIDDDTSGESQGDNNGLPNPGETIELPVQVKNFGTSSAASVTATLTTDDPYITITDGNEAFGTVAGGASVWSADDFDFTIDLGCPHGRVIQFALEVSSGATSWHSLVEVEVISADLQFQDFRVEDGFNGILDPGETAGLRLKIYNGGGITAENAVGTLVSLSPLITVTDAAGTFGSIPAGLAGDNLSDLFEVHADNGAHPGYQAHFLAYMEFSGGMKDTVFAQITVGNRTVGDPIGPDAHGYWAFYNTDVNYTEAPTYNWIEIDPNYGGDGVEISLSDFGEYQDDSKTLDIPFPFMYYGETFTRATVCSNGWMAMGSTYLNNYRNWNIPGAGSPQDMLAVFWDNLYRTGNAAVYQKFDAANHRWIVQWSRMRHFDTGATETFQVLLYDPAHYPTSSGDGEIVYQYETIVNNDSGENYATVGIQNHTQTDGLLYTYANSYPTGAAALAAGRAIRFMPITAEPTGGIAGTVRNDYNNNPIESVNVKLLETGTSWNTTAAGTYSGSAPEGIYTVITTHSSFDPDTTYNVEVILGQQVTVDFYLTDIAAPVITTTQHLTTNDTEGPYEIPVTIEEYTGVTLATLFYRTGGPDWTPVPLTHISGHEYLGEIPGQDYTTYVEYYIYSRDNLGYETYDPAGAPILYYGFLVAPAVQLFMDDLETNQGWTVGAPGDDATTGIWERVDSNAIWEGEYEVQPEDDHTPDPGVLCFVTGNAPEGSAQGTNDVDGGTTTLFSPVIDLSSMSGTANLTYYRWYSCDTGYSTDDVWIVQITDNGTDWVSLENTGTSDRSWRKMDFILNNYVDLTDHIQVKFIASDLGTGGVVEAAVDDFEILFTGTSDVAEEASPAPFLLFQNHPNPASSSTTIRFALDSEGPVHLVLYDIQGRVLRHLIDGNRKAGMQSILWDGRDGSGNKVPSGIYFYRIQTADQSATRKMIFIQ